MLEAMTFMHTNSFTFKQKSPWFLFIVAKAIETIVFSDKESDLIEHIYEGFPVDEEMPMFKQVITELSGYLSKLLFPFVHDVPKCQTKDALGLRRLWVRICLQECL